MPEIKQTLKLIFMKGIFNNEYGKLHFEYCCDLAFFIHEWFFGLDTQNMKFIKWLLRIVFLELVSV